MLINYVKVSFTINTILFDSLEFKRSSKLADRLQFSSRT